MSAYETISKSKSLPGDALSCLPMCIGMILPSISHAIGPFDV